MRIILKYGGYNSRRYSKPWICKVISWPIGSKPIIAWGSYLGNDNGGEVEIEAEAGDVIRSGQKDYRKPFNSDRDWYIVAIDGSLQNVTESQAKKAFLSKVAAQAMNQIAEPVKIPIEGERKVVMS